MPVWLSALLWGSVAGLAVVLGAVLGVFAHMPRRLIAAIMAFGSGVLISALSFELLETAYTRGGFVAAACGFVGGALVYTLANIALARFGARHRKRSGGKQPSESDSPGSGTAIAVGALIDGIPESIAIGVGLVHGGGAGWVTIAAVFLSNVPEGLSSASGMLKAGRSLGFIFGLWTAIGVAGGAAAVFGAVLLGNASANVIAAALSTAAGAILAMVSDTMIPEAFEEAHNWAGLITVAGFMCAYLLSKLGG